MAWDLGFANRRINATSTLIAGSTDRDDFRGGGGCPGTGRPSTVNERDVEGQRDDSEGSHGRRKECLAGAEWSGAPAATKQFALVLDDPDAQFGGQASCTGWSTRFPRAAKGLPAELPMDATLTAPPEIAGTIQGMSGFRRAGYRGPAPPPGKPHHYTFTVYALDADLPLAEGLTKARSDEGMKGHIIGQGALVAIYERVKQ